MERTRYIQEIIHYLANSGGGTLILEPGQWELSTIIIKSKVSLHLKAGTKVLASTDLSLYPRFEPAVDNLEQTGLHLLYAEDAHDISLTGHGIIDGQGNQFWEEAKCDQDKPYGIFKFQARGLRPSPLIEFSRCQNIQIENVRIRNSPSWTLHLCRCREAIIKGVKIRNNLMGPNTDGITINGCQDVMVHQCDIRTGDDCINIKAVDQDCLSERIIVTDCLAQSNCSCFGTGADVRGIIRDVIFSNCQAISSMRMIQMEMWDGGLVENVTFQNIQGNTLPSEGVTCERPIYLDIQQWTKPEIPLGRMRNIKLCNISCRTRGRIVMTAQDGTKIENVTLRDIHISVNEIEDPEIAVPASRSMQNSNYNLETRTARAAIVADNIDGLILDNVAVTWPQHSTVPMEALRTRNVSKLQNNSPYLNRNYDRNMAVLNRE